jgi:hypothetical protein
LCVQPHDFLIGDLQHLELRLGLIGEGIEVVLDVVDGDGGHCVWK